MQDEIQKIYKELQDSIIKLVPEKWQSIYLYASVISGRGGEMFFYFFPKKLIKTKPINCYEIPEKFGIDEEQYNNKLKELYDVIKLLNHCTNLRWSNITISIKKNIFTIEYHYDDLIHSRYTDDERRIYWCYKYLGLPLESLSQEERKIVKNYREESNIKPMIYSEDMTKTNVHNQILKT